MTKAYDKLVNLVNSFGIAEDMAKLVQWKDLSIEDREKLLVMGEEMQDKPQGFQLLKTLHYLATNVDEGYDCRTLLLILDRQDLKDTTREQISNIIAKRIRNSLRQIVPEAKQLQKLQDYFVIKARYAIYLANISLKKSRIQESIQFLQSACDSYRTAENDDLAAEVEQKLLKLLNQGNILELQNRTSELNGTISTLTAQAAEKQQEIDAQGENLKRQQNQFQEGQQFLKGVVNKISEAQKILMDHRKELDSLRITIKETRAELGTLGKLKSYQQAIPEFESRKQQLETSLAGLTNHRNQLKSELLEIQQQHEGLKSKLAAAQDLDAQKQTLLAEIAEAQSKLDSLRLDNQNAETEYKSKDKMRRKIAEIRKEKEGLLAEVSAMQLQVDEAKAYIEQIASLQATQKSLQAEIRRLNKKKADLSSPTSASGEQTEVKTPEPQKLEEPLKSPKRRKAASS